MLRRGIKPFNELPQTAIYIADFFEVLRAFKGWTAGFSWTTPTIPTLCIGMALTQDVSEPGQQGEVSA